MHKRIKKKKVKNVKNVKIIIMITLYYDNNKKGKKIKKWQLYVFKNQSSLFCCNYLLFSYYCHYRNHYCFFLILILFI